jgi:hypothetical protein
MKTCYDEPSIRISITTTDREHIFHWGRTRRTHERFSRRKWDRSWRYRRSVDCTTATNDGLPERPESTRLCAASPWGSEISVRTVLPCRPVPRRISFARLKLGRKLLGLSGSPRGMASEVGCTEFSLGTVGIQLKVMDAGPPGAKCSILYSLRDRVSAILSRLQANAGLERDAEELLTRPVGGPVTDL